MNDEKTLNRAEIGKRIGQIRRKSGLTHCEFSKALHMPAMITEIAEHGIKYTDESPGPINISIDELIRLLKLISETFHVPLSWLMYGEGMFFDVNKYGSPSYEELTLYLPVTISAQSLSDEMNDALTLMDNNPRRTTERAVLQRSSLEAIIQKFRFYEQHAVHFGKTQHIHTARLKMLDAINRIQHPHH